MDLYSRIQRIKRSRILLCGLLALAVSSMGGCEREDDFVTPAFLRIEGISVVWDTVNPIVPTHLAEGLCSSNITSCYVVAHYPGTTHLDSIGLFEMPFSVPVLRNGLVDYIEVFPAVMQSGVSNTQPFYSFYSPIHIDSLTLAKGDTLNLGNLQTSYVITSDNIWHEFFEKPKTSIALDSVEWITDDPVGACTGRGYGRVAVPDTLASVPFSIKRSFEVNDATSLLYLEIDVRCDVRMEVYMHSAYTVGGTEERERVMVVKPTGGEWKHFYINLGRTWAWFNHNPDFKISFAALNVDGQQGEINIDNIKLLATSAITVKN